MTPEQLKEQIDAMQVQVNELLRIVRGLTSAAELDPDIKRTLSSALSSTSGKAASSENQAVNEGGSSSYNVLKPPDSWLKIGDKNIPAYD
jgi:hypothetical protein